MCKNQLKVLEKCLQPEERKRMNANNVLNRNGSGENVKHRVFIENWMIFTIKNQILMIIVWNKTLNSDIIELPKLSSSIEFKKKD